MIDPTVPTMPHSHVNEFLPSSGAAPGSRDVMAEPEMDDFDMTQFNAIRKEQKEQMLELDKHYHERRDIIQKQVQAEQEGLFSAFQQGMQNFYGSLIQHVNSTVEVQVKLRMEQEKLQEDHAARKRDIERRYHHEASKLMLSTSTASRNPKQLPRTVSSGSQANSYAVSFQSHLPLVSSHSLMQVSQAVNGEPQQSAPTASVLQTPPVQHQTATRPVSAEQLPRDFVLQEPPRREYLAPYPTPQEFVPTQRILSHTEHRPIQPHPGKGQPLPKRQGHEETIHSQPQQATLSQQPHQYQEPSHLTPSRSDFKRKAHELPGNDQAMNAMNSKRPRTGENPVEIGCQIPYQCQVRPVPHTPRSSQPKRELQIDRTIPFEEIYQDGKAQYKHKIFEHKAGSGNWYIVRCDEHQVHFGHGNPLHGAAKHVHSPQHGNLEKKHDLALQICGHRITGCNAERAALNNSVFERAVKEEGYVPFNMNLLTKEGKRRLHTGTEVPAVEAPTSVKSEFPSKRKPINLKLNINCDEANGVRDCHFYQGLWSPYKKWYALIVLPILPDGSLKDAGLPHTTLRETDLVSTVPKCYRVDRNSLQIKEWLPAYKIGGSKVNKREYPVMFFDGVSKNSLGWLPAYKLKPLDLENPPDDVDKRGLGMARAWFAQQMMHRKDWEDFQNFGPGQPSPAVLEGELSKQGGYRLAPKTQFHLSDPDTNFIYADQIPLLRSARTDVQSPIRDKSSKPEGFSASSSEEGSDEEDPARMDIGPPPGLTVPSYIDDSSSELSDVEMEDVQKGEEIAAQTSADSQSKIELPSPREMGPEGVREKPKPAGRNEDEAQAAQSLSSLASQASLMEVQAEDRRPPLTPANSDYEQLKRNAQAKAAAAVMEAASRSRASSEVPQLPSPSIIEGPQPGRSSRPAGPEHHRSRSDDNFAINGGIGLKAGAHPLSEVRKPSDLHSILNQEQVSPPPCSNEGPADPYKRAMAIAAQMEGLKSRSASAPIHEGKGTSSPFPPPPLPPPSQGQPSPSFSHIMSPPVQSQSPVMMPPRSSSSTPVQADMGRSSPKILSMDVGQADKWQTVQIASNDCFQRASQTPNKAAFVNTTSTASRPLTASTQLGTPISDKQEFFEVSQFRDSARGVRWSRDGPNARFLRLATDAMRGWAETVQGSPLTADIVPSKIVRIDLDTLEGEKEQVVLFQRDGSQQTLLFEANLESQRLVQAIVQRRRFVNWVKKVNSDVIWRYA